MNTIWKQNFAGNVRLEKRGLTFWAGWRGSCLSSCRSGSSRRWTSSSPSRRGTGTQPPAAPGTTCQPSLITFWLRIRTKLQKIINKTKIFRFLWRKFVAFLFRCFYSNSQCIQPPPKVSDFSERSSFCSNRTQACRFRQTDNSSQAVKGNVLRDWLKYFQIRFKFHRKIWIKKLRVEQDTADRIENFAGFWFFLKGQSGKRLVIWEYIYRIDRNFKNGGQI